jgi:hypothetical protein
VTGVAGAFDDTTQVSATTNINYTGLALGTVSGTGGVLNSVAGNFALDTQVSAATSINYSGFSLGTVNGTGGNTITSAANTAWAFTGVDAGNNGTINWTNFANISDQNAGASSFTGAGGSLTGSLLDAGGTATLFGTITTTGSQAYNGNVVLGGNATTTSTGSSVTMLGTVNGTQTLAVNAATTATITGGVGTTTPPTQFIVTAPAIVLGNVTTNGLQQFNGATTFNSAYVTNGGSFTVNGNTTLNSNSSITTGAGAVALNGTINSQATENNSLTINSSGVTTLGAVGGVDPLSSLSTDAGGTLNLTGNVITTNGMTFGEPVTAGAITLSAGAGNLTATNGANDFSGLLTASGANVSLVDINNLALNLNATGTATISAGDITGTIAVPTLTLTSANAIINDLTLTGVNAITVGGAATEFTFTGASTGNPPATVVNTTGVPVGIFGAPGSWAAAVAQVQAQQQSQTAQNSVAQVIAGEAANTFGTDSVAEQVEYGFAGDVSTAPPMAHRLTGVGIGTPECFAESRDGEACN